MWHVSLSELCVSWRESITHRRQKYKLTELNQCQMIRPPLYTYMSVATGDSFISGDGADSAALRELLAIRTQTQDCGRRCILTPPLTYRVIHQLWDLGFVRLLLRYCSVCPILPGQVEIWQEWHRISAAMAESPSQSSQNVVSELMNYPVHCYL